MPTPIKLLLPLLRGSPFAFPLAAVAALAILVISETSYRQASATFEGIGRQGQARTHIQVLWRSLTDAETGQRGYLLTDRREYLKPYLEAKERVGETLLALTDYYRSEPATAALMRDVSTASAEKISELAETIRLHDEGRESTWRELLLSNIGKDQMDQVRTLSQTLLERESAKVDVARRSLGRTLLLNRLGVSAMAALSLLALGMYLRQTSAVVRMREAQRRAMQAERDQLESEVLARTGQLTDLARHLQTVREDERHHLARELHDELGALLTGAKLDVARLKSRLGAPTPEVAERLQHLSDGLNSGIALKRRIIEDLRPSSLGNLGLVAALDILVREWSQRTGTTLKSALEPVQLRASGELTVYRLVQEALTNISKYAGATEVEVRVWAASGQVHVSVGDNGVGFDTGAQRASAHGLLGMRYRLETEGGQLLLQSAPGRGTLIRADLPESREPVDETGGAAPGGAAPPASVASYSR